MLSSVPRSLTLVGPVVQILPRRVHVHDDIDPATEACVRYAKRPEVLFFESTDGNKTILAPFYAYHEPVSNRPEVYEAEFPVSSKFAGRRCAVGVAIACRNAVLFFPTDSKPPFFQDSSLLLHLHCTLLDESFLGPHCRMGAYLWPIVRSLEGDRIGLLHNGMPSRPMPCYVVTEWQVSLPPPLRYFDTHFVFAERSVLDDLPVKGRNGPLPSWTHGFTFDASNFQPHHGTPSAQHMSLSLMLLRQTDARQDALQQNFYAFSEGMRLVQQKTQELFARNVRGPFADVRIYATLVVSKLDWFVGTRMRLRLMRDIAAWVVASLVPEHPKFPALAAKYPSVVKELKNLSRRLCVVDSADEDYSEYTERSSKLWAEFLDEHSVGLLSFPWRNDFVISQTDTGLHEILTETFCDFVGQADDDAFELRTGLSKFAFSGHIEFEYQRLALGFLNDKIIDRNKLAERKSSFLMTNELSVIDEKLARGVDAEELIRDTDGGGPGDTTATGATGAPPAAPSGGGKFAPRGDNYYAQKGANGNGHMYVVVDPTVAPLDRDAGRLLQWIARHSVRCEPSKRGTRDAYLQSVSPLFFETSAQGEARLTSVTDIAAMDLVANEFEIASEASSESDMDLEIDAVGLNALPVVNLPNGTSVTLSEEQCRIVRSLSSHWLTMITGGGGTGKSLLIAAITTLCAGRALADYHDKESELHGNLVEYIATTECAVVMAYGTPMSNFSRRYNIPATTIHYASAVLNGNYANDDRNVFKSARKASLAAAKILIMDEVTVLSLDHMVLAMCAFPLVQKYILVGDTQQMRSIDRGDIAAILETHYARFPGWVWRLSRNFRLAQGANPDRMEERTHAVFDAVIAGALTENATAYGPLQPTVRSAALPGMVAFENWSDLALIKRTLTTTPTVHLPHVRPDLPADRSLPLTCDALIALFGLDLLAWRSIQFITQRHEEVRSISDYLTRKLFPQIPVHPQFNSLPAFDLFVGERVVFRFKLAGFDPAGNKMTNYKNGIRVIERIADVTETTLEVAVSGEPGDSDAKKKRPTTVKRSVFSSPETVRSTQHYAQIRGHQPKRRRVVYFTDGSYVVSPYTHSGANKEMKFLARGICSTNASMQGLAEKTIVLYIRPGVSHTFDRNEVYTAFTRTSNNVIVVASREDLDKVVKQQPPVRRNQFAEYLPSDAEVAPEMLGELPV